MLRILLFCFALSLIQADLPGNQIANLNGEPSAIVAGCVNVINGSFFDVQQDLFMTGGQPLILERSYCSSDTSSGVLSNGWNFNLQGEIFYRTVVGSYGSQVGYLKDGTVSETIFQRGATNNASGILSAKTNLKNNLLSSSSDTCTLRQGDFSHSIYSKHRKDYYRLTCDLKPNNMQIHYSYGSAGMEAIFAANTLGQKQQYIQFIYSQKKIGRPQEKIIVYASDGRQIQYDFQQFRYSDGNYRYLQEDRDSGTFRIKEPKESPPPKPTYEGDFPRYYLSYVNRPNAPPEKYIYEEKDLDAGHLERLIEKRLPNDRFLRISYEDGKVGAISGPIGSTYQAYPICKFQYKEKSCQVENALGFKTQYFWDDNKHLKKVVQTTSSGQPYLTNQLFWGEGRDNGNLRARICSDAKETLFCKCYRYDQYGNVLNEWLYGNLSGHNAAPLIIENNGVPRETGCERIEKKYTYSNDLRNLLLVEEEGSRSKRYRYYPNSDLVALVFTMDGDRVVLRNGYLYDEDCNTIVEILDDGISGDPNDLTGATFRKIKRIQRRKTHPFGVPEVVEEYSQDPATREEFLLRMQINSYSIEGRLIQQDHYGSERDYAYSLFWQYDSYGHVVCETDAMGQKTHRQYDANGNLIYEQGPRSDCCKEFSYDYSNRLISTREVHPDKQLVSHYSYDLLGRKITSIDCYGNETNFDYDEFDRVIKITSPAVHGKKAIAKKVYDSLGNVRHDIDHMGRVINAVYNVRGKPVNILYPDGSSEHFNYCLHGPLASKIERNGCTVYYKYDYQDRIIETSSFDPNRVLLWQTSAVYNALHILSETDASGRVTEYSYDVHGRKIATKCCDRFEEYEYDTLSRLSKTTTHYGLDSPEVIVKTYKYNNAGQVIEERIENFCGNVLMQMNYAYDASGKQSRVSKYNHDGIIQTEIRYDSYGVPFEVIDALGNVTRTIHKFHTNACGQFVAYQEVIDPLGNSTAVIKDPLGRDYEVIHKDAMGQITRKREIFYDLNGNQIQVIETVLPSHTQIAHAWQYDSMNRAISCIEAQGTPEQRETKYHYNSIGQLEWIQKPSGVLLYHQYTADGLLASFSSSDNTFHYTYVYDGRRNLIESRDELHNISTKRSYDSYNQVTEEELSNGLWMRYSYDGTGRLKQLSLPDDSTLSYAYESVLLRQIHRDSLNTCYSHTYNQFDLSLNPIEQTLIGVAGKLSINFDQKNRIRSIMTRHTSEEVPCGGYDSADNLLKRTIKDALGEFDASYAYDALYQVTEEKGAAEHSYVFDSLHNRISKDGIASSYNHLNQISDEGYVYDLDGRLIETPTEKFAYDALDRLTSYTKDDCTACYLYDSFNRRISKTIEGDVWHYFYADQNEIGCYYDGAITEFRALGLGRGAEIGAAVAIELNGIVYAPVHDLNGNVTTLLDSSGNVADTYRYTAFGEEILKPQLANPWRFSSKRVDEESSLSYFGRRYYAPALSRWLTPDPLSYQAGPNLYAYASCNPLTHIDLYGLIDRVTREMPSAKFVKEVIHRTYDSICDYTSRIRDKVSTVADRVTDHVRNISDSVCSIASSVRSTFRDFSNTFLVSNLDLKSQSGRYSGVIDYPLGAPTIIYVPGQNNDAISTLNMAMEISKLHGDVPVDYIVAQTHGLLGDTSKSCEMKLGFDNLVSVKELVKLLESRLADKGSEVLVYATSQGAITLSCAINRIGTDKQRRMRVAALGGGTILPKGSLKDCKNYWSRYDLVTPIADLIGLLASRFMPEKYQVEVLRGERFLMDHYFMEGPYYNKINDIGRNYREKYVGP